MCAVISAGMPAATARAKGTSSSAASARRERRTRGRTKCESPALAPCPGKCFPQASTPARPRPRASATPRRATRAGSVPKARSPITRLRGSDQTSSTAPGRRSMPPAGCPAGGWGVGGVGRVAVAVQLGARRMPADVAGAAAAAGSARRTALASGLLPQPSMRPARRPRRRSEAGIAMAIALFTLMVFIVLAATSSLIASSDVRATRDARGGSQAHFVAEAAIAEELQRVNAPGVVNFQNDVVGQWAGLWGAGTHTFGLGFSSSPLTPSIMTSPAAPSIAQMNQIIDDLLALPSVVPYGDNNINGHADFGTNAAPQISHFTNAAGVTIKANGDATGAGIMIVEGDLTIQGNRNFNGLILVRGRTSVQVTEVIGNATLYGSLWTQDIDLNVGGSAIVNYSTQALALANQVGGTHPLPSPLKVLSLADCGMMPSGVGGCP